jgi:hypothetical protein
MDVALLFTPNELLEFFSPSTDLLNQYVSSAVISNSAKTDQARHRFRRTLQLLVASRFGGDILNFLNYLLAPYPNIATHLYRTCTEASLGQLVFLISSTDDIFETRARLLD